MEVKNNRVGYRVPVRERKKRMANFARKGRRAKTVTLEEALMPPVQQPEKPVKRRGRKRVVPCSAP